MDAAWNDFAALVAPVVERMARQQDRTVSRAEVDAFARRLADVMAACPLPPPLLAGDPGRPGGMADAECARLVALVVGPEPDRFFAEVARQVIKACLHPVFTQCRDSYRERAADGHCRRQERDRTRLRVSGAPCVDCPYWTSLDGPAHGRLLDDGWVGNPAAWRAEADLYLPDDFRALRRWVGLAAGDKLSS
jgi:hypothetical protein